MKSKFKSPSARNLFLPTAISAAISLMCQASAANITWDITPGTVGTGDAAITGGLGSWDTTLGNWTSDSGANNIAWNNAGNDTAVFGGTAGIVTLGTAITAGGLTFNNTGYTVTGPQTLTLAGTTPTITVASGSTAILGSAVAFVINGTAGLTKSGPGTLTLTSSSVYTHTGSTTVNGGQISLSFASTTPDNLIPTANPLSLNGGALSMLLASGLTKSQTLGGTTLTSGNSAIHMNKNGTGTGTLILGAITRSSGATLNLGLTSNGVTNKNIQSSSFASGAVVTDNGVAYATTFIKTATGSTGVSPATGDDWASYNGTTIVAPTYTGSTGSTLSGNASIATGTDTTLAADASVTTLRANLAEARSINLGGFTLTTGGVLVASTVAANTTLITGGTLKSAATASGKDLVIFTNNTGITSIGTIIADSAAGATGLTKSGPGNLTLSGTNSYTGPTIINTGSLTSSLAAALGTTPSVLIGSGAALTVSYGGPSSYTNPEITALLAKTTFADSTSGFGFDTTDATGGTANYAGGFTGSTGLAKSGTGTLVLTGSNSHTGTTSVFGGTLQVADTGALGGTTLGTVVSNGASLALSGGITITGEALSLLGEGVSTGGALRSISGNNSWTSDITLAGTARVNADAGNLTLGAVGTSGTLELSGDGNISVNGLVTGTTAIAIADLIGDGTTSGTMTLSGANTNTGVITVNSGKLSLTGNRTADLTGGFIVGTTAAKTGTLAISNGNFSTGIGDIQVGTLATATGIINQTAGTISTTPTSANNGRILMGTLGAGTYNLSGGTLNANGTGVNAFILGTNSGGSAFFNLSGTGTVTMGSPTGLLQIGRSNSTTTANTGSFIQTGGTASISNLSIGGGGINNNATTGVMEITGGTFAVAGNFNAIAAGPNCIASILIGGTADVTLPAFPTGLAVPVPVGAGSIATITFDGGTLKPAAASAFYMGGLTEATIQDGGAKFDVATGKDITIAQNLLTHASSLGGGLTKIGVGTLTLSGANTYTGGTAVNEGTLALVGGSQQSAITVADGAFLGFTLDSGTTSTSTVTFGATSKVKITGTPTLSSYTLMTTTGISGTPVLDAPISGYQLVVDGNSLKLNSSSGYATWQTANSTGQTINLDHDSDGVSNGVEYFLLGPVNTTGFNSLPGVVDNAGTLSITWVKSGVYNGNYGTDFFVETSSTLATGGWTTVATSGTPSVANTVYINGNNVTYTFPAGTKNFARLKVTGP